VTGLGGVRERDQQWQPKTLGEDGAGKRALNRLIGEHQLLNLPFVGPEPGRSQKARWHHGRLGGYSAISKGSGRKRLERRLYHEMAGTDKFRWKSKTYLVKDGDVLHFLFSADLVARAGA
jgi:hypothetical protein